MKTSKRIPISSLKPGQCGIVDQIETEPEVNDKLMEMGFSKGEHIRFIRKSPLGDPIEFELLNTRLAIRKSEADRIYLNPHAKKCC